MKFYEILTVIRRNFKSCAEASIFDEIYLRIQLTLFQCCWIFVAVNVLIVLTSGGGAMIPGDTGRIAE